MKIAWVSNYMGQPTGYGKIANNVAPWLQRNTDHEVIHFAVSGLQNVLPFENQGVRVYGSSSMGGNLGMNDLPVIKKMEDVDLFLLNLDCWAVSQEIQQFDIPFCYYAPVDHSPLPKNQADAMEEANKVIPYCEFGKRVISQAIEDEKIYDSFIPHGVDTDVYKPMDIPKKEMFGVGEDTFVFGIFKNNQGTRANYSMMLRAFKKFLDDTGADDAMLYIHSSIQGRNSPNLSYLIPRLGLGDKIKLVNQGQYRWGLPEEQLAALYNGIDAELNVTCGEGYGLIILEAFACGKPIIGTAFSSMPELLLGEEGEIERTEIDGEFVDAERGLLVPTHSPTFTLGKHSWRRQVHIDSVVEAMKYAYENQEEMGRKGESARKWVLENNLDWSSIADEWGDFFDYYESEFFEKDEEKDVTWKKVGKKGEEYGGVGAWGR